MLALAWTDLPRRVQLLRNLDSFSAKTKSQNGECRPQTKLGTPLPQTLGSRGEVRSDRTSPHAAAAASSLRARAGLPDSSDEPSTAVVHSLLGTSSPVDSVQSLINASMNRARARRPSSLQTFNSPWQSRAPLMHRRVALELLPCEVCSVAMVDGRSVSRRALRVVQYPFVPTKLGLCIGRWWNDEKAWSQVSGRFYG